MYHPAQCLCMAFVLVCCGVTQANEFAAPTDVVGSQLGASNSRSWPPDGAQDIDSLRRGFSHPRRDVGPWAIWFWWDGVLARDEIARELEEIAKAGFAGAEIRCVTFHGWDGPPLIRMDAESLQQIGHRRYEYLSDDFIDILKFTCVKARELGLRLGINMGQGWPPGGPWIRDEHRSKHLAWESQEIEGPARFAMNDLGGDDFVLAWRLADGRSKRDSRLRGLRQLGIPARGQTLLEPRDFGSISQVGRL